MINEKSISGLICVSSRDIPYLFEYAFISSLEKINFIDRINILTSDLNAVKEKLSKLNFDSKIPINIIPDSELLLKEELELCGWSRQQIIKLRSYKLGSNENILNVGADTVILRNQVPSDFYNPDHLVVNYRRHGGNNKHYQFEIERSKNICNLLGVEITQQAEVMRDYIFDVFFFKREILEEFERYLFKRFGSNYFSKVFPRVVNGYEDMVKIGEWTLYTIYAIKILRLKYRFQDASKIVHQIHSQKELDIYDYSAKAIHFVRKDFDKEFIFSRIKKHLSYYESVTD